MNSIKLKTYLVIIFIFFSCFSSIVSSDDICIGNQYGEICVYPKISNSDTIHKQFFNLTVYGDYDIDVAFVFNETQKPLSGGIWYKNYQSNYTKLNHEYHNLNGKHAYVFSVSLNAYQMYQGYYQYTQPINTCGKWDMYVKLQSDTWNNYRVHLDPWWNSSYDKFVTIGINNSYVDNDLIDYPILVNLTSEITQYCQNDGDDIRFIDLNNITEYPFEIEYFSTIANSYFWVKIPRIYSANITKFNCYFDNDIAENGENITGTWNSNYKCVLHMNQLDTVSLDSTSNNFDFSDVSTKSPIYQQSGKIKYGLEFSEFGANDGDVIINSANDITGWDDATIQVWYSPDILFENNDYLFSSLVSSIDDIRMSYHAFGDDSSGLQGYWDDGTAEGCHIYTYSYDIDKWYFFASVIDGDNFVKNYENDSLICSDNSVNFDFSGVDNNHYIGARYHTTNKYFVDGILDEFRISDIVRNDSWLKLDFHCQNMTDGLLLFSDIESYPLPCTCNITNEFPENNSLTISPSVINLTVDVNSTLGCTIDYINISLLNASHNVSSVTNGTFYLNFSGIFSLNGTTVYTWYVNTSCNGTQNNTYFKFTTGSICPSNCELYALIILNQNELNTLNENLEMGIGLIMLFFVLIIGCIFAINVKNKPIDQKQQKEKK